MDTATTSGGMVSDTEEDLGSGGDDMDSGGDVTMMDGSMPPDGDASSDQDAATDMGEDMPPLMGPAMLTQSCMDDTLEIYDAPDNLPPMDPSLRGDVVKCGEDPAIDVASLNARLATAGVVGELATSGARTLRILYRTERRGGIAGLSSARVYLPDEPRDGPLPIVVVAHGTVGLSDLCAPSLLTNAIALDYLALPWVARGHVVIAPDFAGLGTEGVQGYGDNIDTGHSTLDAAKALRALLAPERLSDKVLVVGHSQGGGAALSAQALASSYGAGGELAGVIAFAPGWQTQLDDVGWANFWFTNFDFGGSAAIVSMLLYAYHANVIGEDSVGDGFPLLTRLQLESAVELNCFATLPAAVATVTLGLSVNLIDETFRSTFVDCLDGNGCVEPGKSYYDYLNEGLLTADPNGAEILVVQGLTDVTVPAVQARCVVDALEAAGATPQVCVDASTHINVAQLNATRVMDWAEALVDGESLPSCNGEGLPPMCGF